MQTSPFAHQWGFVAPVDVEDEDPTPELSACGFFGHLTPVEAEVEATEQGLQVLPTFNISSRSFV